MEKVFLSLSRCLCERKCVRMCVYVPFKGSFCLCCIHINALQPALKHWRVHLSTQPPHPENLEQGINTRNVRKDNDFDMSKDESRAAFFTHFCDFTKRHLLLLPRLLYHEQSQWWTASAQGQIHRDSIDYTLLHSQRNVMYLASRNKPHRKRLETFFLLSNPDFANNIERTERNERKRANVNGAARLDIIWDIELNGMITVTHHSFPKCHFSEAVVISRSWRCLWLWRYSSEILWWGESIPNQRILLIAQEPSGWNWRMGEQNLFLQAIALTKKIAMSSMVLKPQLLLDCSLSMGIKS